MNRKAAEGAVSGGRHAVRYASCALEEEVFLHPRSALHKTASQFVVYSQLVRTVKRPYMAGVSAIEVRADNHDTVTPAGFDDTCVNA